MPSMTPSCITCQINPPLWQRCATALSYQHPWPDIIGAYKYQNEAGLVGFLAQQMQASVQIQELLQSAHCLLPVPLSAQRLRQRGFNQSLLLAKALSPHITWPDALLRLRDTLPQAGLTREDRLHNLAHAFACNPHYFWQLQGQHVVLIDDVMTTGSTLQACTQVLLTAGVTQVNCIVLARATGDKPPQSGLAN